MSQRLAVQWSSFFYHRESRKSKLQSLKTKTKTKNIRVCSTTLSFEQLGNVLENCFWCFGFAFVLNFGLFRLY